MAPTAEADCISGRRRFAAACSVLSRCVKAEAAASGNMAAAAAAHGCPAAQASPTMLLMPGADVVGVETTPPAPAPAPAQLVIKYGRRVLVFDGVPADRVAEVMRAAARHGGPGPGSSGGGPAAADLQVARKASLQRLMEKRRHRLAARAPYATAAPAGLAVAATADEGREEADAATWLGLGLAGGRAR